MIAKVVAVNAAAILLLAALSYVLAAVMLNGLASLERSLDPSLKPQREHQAIEDLKDASSQTRGPSHS